MGAVWLYIKRARITWLEVLYISARVKAHSTYFKGPLVAALEWSKRDIQLTVPWEDYTPDVLENAAEHKILVQLEVVPTSGRITRLARKLCLTFTIATCYYHY